MTALVTGGTGFIGRRLVERLVARGESVFLLVRPSSAEKATTALARYDGSGGSVTIVEGDISIPGLALSGSDVDKLTNVDHLFHLAAVYDMTASAEVNDRANILGTQHVVDLGNTLRAKRFHHVSSIAVAGEYDGFFREDMFDEGQKLPSDYHRSKFEAEAIVRKNATVPWRVYRPAVVVGDSETGEMDKVDGPYYFFSLLKKLKAILPPWVPLAGPELGYTNIVPVDYVADALDHIAYADGLDGQAFHLTHPRGIRVGAAMNIFADAAGAPRMAVRVDARLLDALPKGVISMLLKVPALKGIRDSVLSDLGIPPEVVEHIALVPRFDTRDAERALEGSGIAVPELADYAAKLWDFWARELDPALYVDRTLRHAVEGRTVLITGGSSGIGRATALLIAEAGGIPLLVARGKDNLDEAKAEIEAAGGTAYTYPTDLSDLESIDGLVAKVLEEHGGVDFLINNAGRSIRRSIAMSHDRFHDFERTMQLNYFGTIRLIMGLLPTMQARKAGHIVNVSSIGVQTNPPRFAAYVASKAALDAFTRIASTETLGDNVTFTTIHMPLVRTPMIAPTRLYDSVPTITPEEAAHMVGDAIRFRPKTISTRLGTFGEVSYALMPKVVDQVLHLAYKVLPDSTRSQPGDKAERPSAEALAFTSIMKGVHW